MLVINFLTSLVFNLWPVPIKPTLVHVPVIIASIVYGPRIGAILGGLMGIMSVTVNTLTLLPTSYLFSPFVENGNFASLIIALVPRILIGITPYFVYKWLHNRTGTCYRWCDWFDDKYHFRFWGGIFPTLLKRL